MTFSMLKWCGLIQLDPYIGTLVHLAARVRRIARLYDAVSENKPDRYFLAQAATDVDVPNPAATGSETRP